MDIFGQLIGYVIAYSLIPAIGYLILKGAVSIWRKVIGWIILGLGLLGAFASLVMYFVR